MLSPKSSRRLLWSAWAFLVLLTLMGLYRYTYRVGLPLKVDAGPAGLEISELLTDYAWALPSTWPETESPLFIREVAGMRVRRYWHIRVALAGRRVGDMVVLGLGTAEDVGPATSVEQTVTVVKGYETFDLLTLILVGITTLGLAGFLLFHRDQHPATIPLAATLALLGSSLALEEWGAPLGAGLLRWLPGVLWAYTYTLVAPAIISFASAFTLESGFWRRFGWLRPAAWMLGAAIGTCIALGIILYVGLGNSIGFHLCLRCQPLLWCFLAGSVVFAGLSFYVAYRQATDWGRRNRIRWVLLGTALGGILPLTLIILPRALGLDEPLGDAPLLFLVLLPVCLVISVVRHQLLDISVVVRQGLMYGPATVVVYLVYGGAFTFVVYLLIKLSTPGFQYFSPETAIYIALALLLFHLLFEPLRQRVQSLVNRIFFRTKFSYGRTVRAFSDELDQRLTGVAILNYLCSKILQTVAPAWVQVVDTGEEWKMYWDNVERADLVEESQLRLPFHDLDNLELWLGPKRSGMAYHNYDRMLLETLVGLASTGLQREVLQRQLLAEAAEKERLETLTKLKDDFLSLVSHDLRSPLAAITVSASVLARRSEEAHDDKGHTDAQRIERNAQRLGHMVERILHTARVEAGRVSPELESCQLQEVASAAIERHQLMADGVGVALENLVAEEAVVRADPLLLQEALSNLVDNALKVSDKGTTITIGAQRAGSGWKLTVADQGPGIPEDRLPTLFERGEVSGTGKRTGGFGLGLYLVRELVELQGGGVELRETTSEGTTFAIQLQE